MTAGGLDLVDLGIDLLLGVVLWTAGMVFIFLPATAVIWVILMRLGWLGVSAKGPGPWLAFSLVVWLFFGFLAGAAAGAQVGLAKTGVFLADLVGRPLFLDMARSFEEELDPGVRVPVGEARRWVQTIKTWRPIQGDGWAAWLADKILDRVRGPYLVQCEAYLAPLGPDDGVLPSEMAAAVWDGASAQVRALANSFARGALMQSAGFMAIFMGLWTGIVSMVRAARARKG